MPMSFETLQSLVRAATNPDQKIRAIVDYLRDNSIGAVVDAAAVVNAIPTADPQDDGVTIWSDEGVLKVSGAAE